MRTFMYIDPGLGSMLFQVVVGAIAAFGATLYMFRQKVTKFFGCNSKKQAFDKMEKEKHNE